jgi:hypothetical protein
MQRVRHVPQETLHHCKPQAVVMAGACAIDCHPPPPHPACCWTICRIPKPQRQRQPTRYGHWADTLQSHPCPKCHLQSNPWLFLPCPPFCDLQAWMRFAQESEGEERKDHRHQAVKKGHLQGCHLGCLSASKSLERQIICMVIVLQRSFPFVRLVVEF